MTEASIEQGHISVNAALARVRQNAVTATFAATLVSLAAGAAQASTIAIPGPVVLHQNSVLLSNSYSVSNTYTDSIYKIEFPEIHAGDLNFSGIGALPANWFAREQLTPNISGNGLKSGTAGAYVDLYTDTYSGSPITSGASLIFIAKVPTLATINSNVGLAFVSTGTVVIDPPIPNTTAVPEPGTFAVLGSALLGLAGLRRRSKA